MRRIYLAGPITGLSYAEARNGWRQDFADLLKEKAPHIECYSPMRAKQFLEDQKAISGDPEAYKMHPMAVARGIVTRDHNDVITCDAVVANLAGAKVASVGTVFEMAWCFAYRKPLIVIMGDDERDIRVNPHWHPFPEQAAGYVVPTLLDAAHIVQHLLTPGI
jgi:nucleoside 2-deoxyribosyltransferase